MNTNHEIKPNSHDEDLERQPTDPAVVKLLIDNQKKFLGFLEKRLQNRQLAEEILQDAFIKTIEKGSDLREGEGAVAWFYRLLRNAIIDNYRRQGSKEKALNFKTAEEKLLAEELDPEFENAICGCMKTLLPTLKNEYSEILNKVDLEEQSLTKVAEELGISTTTRTLEFIGLGWL